LTTFASLLPVNAGVGHAAAGPEAEPDQLSLYFDESQLVEVATRAPKPITQIAESVTVVTAEEIERMHASNLSDVLNRVPGLYVEYYGQDFGSSAVVRLQGAREWHTLALIDGVRLNDASGGFFHPGFIPVDIIERIEIIKGPASSAWGSALGGVINIVTKNTGNDLKPKSDLTVSYGEADSSHYGLDASGRLGAASYFLYGGGLSTDGLRGDRAADRDAAYGKFRYELPGKASLTVAGGYSDNFNKEGEFHSIDLDGRVWTRPFWGTVYADLPLAGGFAAHFALQRFDMRFIRENDVLGLGVNVGVPGDLFARYDYDEETTSYHGRLTWTSPGTTVTVGVEGSRSSLDYLLDYGATWGGPGSLRAVPATDERRGVYANTTLTWGNFAVTPGLRYDYSSISDEFFSPSLGATWRVFPDTLLRLSIARGFSAPYLKLISGGSDWEPVNPDLKPEIIDSYQFGIESTRLRYVLLKVSLFHQQIKDVWISDSPVTNQGKARWNGYELEAASSEYKGFILHASFSSSVEDSAEVENDKLYEGNVVLDYWHHALNARAQLAGHYVWWDRYSENDFPKHDDVLWDLSLSRDISWERISGEVFFNVHNLFNASQYWDFEYRNPDRWVEAGLKLSF